MVMGGRYELAGQVGNGGYCEVWRATDTVLSRPVAVKLLHPGYAGKAEALARFEAEARHAGALSHPNIARVYDYGEPADGQPPYLVMELVDGPSLEEVLASGPLGARQSMDVIAQAAAGLQVAHDAGLIHRDVKPANLLLASGGIVKITDFGVARAVGSAAVTPSGEMMGTPGYHAPEQVAGGQATSASDLYALGVVAYECLAGARPFTGTAVEMAVAHRDRPLPPLPPSVPVDVSALVDDLTAKDPARRPASAAQVALRAALLRDGRRATTGGPHPAPEAQAQAPAAGRPCRGRRRPGLALAATVLTGLTGLVLATLIGFAPSWHAVRVPASPPSAQPPRTGTPARTAGGQATIPATPATPVTPAAQPRAPAGPAAVSSIPAPAPPGHSPAHGRGHGHGNGNGNGNGNS
jgi:hypothetical protein